jgi:hypothetical protein
MNRTDVPAGVAAFRILAASILVGLAGAEPAVAGEGGGSHYMPGTSGDFAMALIGPSGFYLRNDLIYFEGDIGPVTLGDRVYTSASQDVWVDTVKLIYLGEGGILGGRFGAVASIPIVLDATVAGELAVPVGAEASGNRAGLSDVTLTGFLNWSSGNNHVSAGLNIFIPIGAYSGDRIINLGRNYWSFDPTVTCTWLDPKRGHEISFTTGLMFNTKNDATDYTSGTEWHLDFMFSQHFSKQFALGIEGSLLQGVSDDDGPLLDRANVVLPALGLKPLGGFRAEYFGLGPAVVYTSTIGGTDFNFIAKYLMDVEHRNRFNSDYLIASVAFKF